MKLKRFLSACLVGILIAGSTASVPSSVQAAGKWPEGPAKDSLSCKSAIVMELSTGTILYEKNIYKELYPASITKIMTSLLTLENCSLDETVTFTEEEAHGIESGSSSCYSVPGETFTVEQLLYGIMLQSANEMCLAAADHVAGSVPAFADMMNKRVASLGLKHTHFCNPNGLHDDNHYTCAYDMANIAREAWKNPTFRKITGTKRHCLGSTNKRKANEILGGQLLNHHQMLNGYENPQYEYPYCIGGKTGFTSMAHSTLVTYAEKDGMQLVSVIMKANSPKQGEPNEYTDTRKILDYAFGHYEKHLVDTQTSTVNDNLFNSFNTYFSETKSPISLSGESAVILPKGASIEHAKQKIRYNKNLSLISGKNTIGSVEYFYQGHTVGSSDIIYDNSENKDSLTKASRKIMTPELDQLKTNEEKHSFFSEKISAIKYGFVNFISFFKERVFLIVAFLLVLLLAFLFYLKYRISSRRSRRRRSRDRRRKNSGGMYLNSKKNVSFSHKKGKRRRGTDYTSSRRINRSTRKSGSSNMSNRKLKKNHSRTKESFGKNFYDF